MLHTTQNRLREKTFLASMAFRSPHFEPSDRGGRFRRAQVSSAQPRSSKPPISATTVRAKSASTRIPNGTGKPGTEYVYEAFVDFEREVSVVAARGVDGAFAHWGVIENSHKDGILDLSVSPADVPAKVQSRAIEIARAVLESLDVSACCASNFSSPARASCSSTSSPATTQLGSSDVRCQHHQPV